MALRKIPERIADPQPAVTADVQPDRSRVGHAAQTADARAADVSAWLQDELRLARARWVK
jgi:hypothetical protein